MFKRILIVLAVVVTASHTLETAAQERAQEGVQEQRAVQAGAERVLPSAVSARGKGLTWRLIKTNAPTGTIRVGCGHSSGKNECDPYQGDTPCNTALPLLCINKTGPGFPLPRPASVDDTSNYNKWSGGVVGTTSATVPTTLAGANALCAKEFGSRDWVVAEHHDGWGWYFQAYGGVGDPTKRFWIHINDQLKGTCWK